MPESIEVSGWIPGIRSPEGSAASARTVEMPASQSSCSVTTRTRRGSFLQIALTGFEPYARHLGRPIPAPAWLEPLRDGVPDPPQNSAPAWSDPVATASVASRAIMSRSTRHGSAAGRAARAAASMIKASLSRLSKSARASPRTSAACRAATADMPAVFGWKLCRIVRQDRCAALFRSLLGISGQATAPTYDGLYTGSWQHPKCNGEKPGEHPVSEGADKIVTKSGALGCQPDKHGWSGWASMMLAASRARRVSGLAWSRTR